MVESRLVLALFQVKSNLEAPECLLCTRGIEVCPLCTIGMGSCCGISPVQRYNPELAGRRFNVVWVPQ